MRMWLLTWSPCNKGKSIAGVVTPPTIGFNVSDEETKKITGIKSDQSRVDQLTQGFHEHTRGSPGW